MKVYASQDFVEEKTKEKISAPSVATVGQIISVKTVDENGKPIEWEMIDPWTLIDEKTGTKYKLSVVDGKLTMAESEVA